MEYIIPFLIDTILSGSFLYVGMKLTNVDGTFLAMLIIAGVSTLCAFIPIAGGVAATAVMFILVVKWTDADFWPDAVLMVVVARGVELIGGIFLIRLLM